MNDMGQKYLCLKIYIPVFGDELNRDMQAVKHDIFDFAQSSLVYALSDEKHLLKHLREVLEEGGEDT